MSFPQVIHRRRAPYAELHADGHAELFGSYVPLLPYRLRSGIPAPDRRYDAARRCWTIAPAHALVALRTFRGVFPDATIITVRGVA